MAQTIVIISNNVTYQAFLSYSQSSDAKLGAALQSGLQQFAKSWNQLRGIRIFRDKTGMSVNPGLWAELQRALEESEYMILLASPPAAASPWVSRELEAWLKLDRAARLLIVLTDGNIAWDAARDDFDWTTTNSLPAVLRSYLHAEPLWFDLRWARTMEHRSLENPTFREAVAELASAIRGIPKDQLIGEDVRQHRKLVQYRRIALFTLALLAIGLGAAAFVAYREQRRAVANEVRAVENERLAKQKEGEANDNADLARLNADTAKRNEEAAKRNEEAAHENERLAKRNADEARRQADLAVARQLAAQAEVVWRTSPHLIDRAVLLGVAATQRSPVSADGQALVARDSSQVLQGALDDLPRWRLRLEGDVVLTFFSPGSHYVVIGYYGRIRYNEILLLCEVASGKTIARWVLPAAATPLVRFSPDERYLIMGAPALSIIDTNTGKEVRAGNPDEHVTTLSVDGRFAAVRSTSGTNLPSIWESVTGRFVASVPDIAIELSPDGRHAILAHQTARLYDIVSTADGPSVPIYGAKFSPDGRLVVTNNVDELLVYALEVSSWKEVARKKQTLFHPVWSDDGGVLAGFDPAGVIHVLNATRLVEIATVKSPQIANLGDLCDFALSGDASAIALATRDGSIYLNKLRTGAVAHIAHGGLPRAVALSSNGTIIAIGGVGGAQVGDVIPKIFCKSGELSADGQLVACASRRDITQPGLIYYGLPLTDLRTGNDRWFVGSNWPMDVSALSANGRIVAGRSSNNSYQVMEADTGKTISRGSDWKLALSGDGRRRAEASLYGRENTIRVIDRENTLVARVQVEPRVNAMAFDWGGRTLAVAFGDKKARLYDADHLSETASMPHASEVTAVRFSNDSKWLATGSKDGTALVWEAVNSREMSRLIHSGAVIATYFSHDGRYLATLTEERGSANMAHIFEITMRKELWRREVSQLLGFSDDDRYLITATNNFLQKNLWASRDLIDAACARLDRNLTEEEWRQYLPGERYEKACSGIP